jgi:hypothetical protein
MTRGFTLLALRRPSFTTLRPFSPLSGSFFYLHLFLPPDARCVTSYFSFQATPLPFLSPDHIPGMMIQGLVRLATGPRYRPFIYRPCCVRSSLDDGGKFPTSPTAVSSRPTLEGEESRHCGQCIPPRVLCMHFSSAGCSFYPPGTCQDAEAGQASVDGTFSFLELGSLAIILPGAYVEDPLAEGTAPFSRGQSKRIQ